MGVQVLSQTQHKARKEHYDSGLDQILEGGIDFMTFPERMYIHQRIKKRKIQIGEIYVAQHNIMDGDFYTWKTTPRLLEIMKKYDIFDD